MWVVRGIEVMFTSRLWNQILSREAINFTLFCFGLVYQARSPLLRERNSSVCLWCEEQGHMHLHGNELCSSIIGAFAFVCFFLHITWLWTNWFIKTLTLLSSFLSVDVSVTNALSSSLVPWEPRVMCRSACHYSIHVYVHVHACTCTFYADSHKLFYNSLGCNIFYHRSLFLISLSHIPVRYAISNSFMYPILSDVLVKII